MSGRQISLGQKSASPKALGCKLEMRNDLAFVVLAIIHSCLAFFALRAFLTLALKHMYIGCNNDSEMQKRNAIHTE